MVKDHMWCWKSAGVFQLPSGSFVETKVTYLVDRFPSCRLERGILASISDCARFDFSTKLELGIKDSFSILPGRKEWYVRPFSDLYSWNSLGRQTVEVIESES
jgi:hypothetical protein